MLYSGESGKQAGKGDPYEEASNLLTYLGKALPNWSDLPYLDPSLKGRTSSKGAHLFDEYDAISTLVDAKRISHMMLVKCPDFYVAALASTAGLRTRLARLGIGVAKLTLDTSPPPGWAPPGLQELIAGVALAWGTPEE